MFFVHNVLLDILFEFCLTSKKILVEFSLFIWIFKNKLFINTRRFFFSFEYDDIILKIVKISILKQ